MSQRFNYTDGISQNPSLNFSLYASELSRIAVQATENNEGAFTVGIFGSWGSGKTTLMRQIEAQLKGNNSYENFNLSKCKTIWFNSWKYDEKEAIWNALIQSILVEIEKDTRNDEPLNNRIKELAKNIGFHAYDISKEVFIGLIRTQIKKYTDVELSTKDFNLSKEQLRELDIVKVLSEHYKGINAFETDFKSIVDAYVGEKGKLIVFIDDLDRCLPENALAVLEALKLYLDQASCVFFIGLDKRVIEQAVAHRYKDSNITGKEYIEKMIQLNFFLPDKDPESVKFAIQSTLKEIALIEDEIWDMLLRATKANFRRTKQFIIAWNIVKNIAISLGIEQKTLPKMAKVLLIQMYFPDFYDVLPKYNYTLMEKMIRVLDADRSGNGDKLNSLLEDNSECKRFFSNSDLINFLRGDFNDLYAPHISEAEELKAILKILSQAGRNSIQN